MPPRKRPSLGSSGGRSSACRYAADHRQPDTGRFGDARGPRQAHEGVVRAVKWLVAGYVGRPVAHGRLYTMRVARVRIERFRGYESRGSQLPRLQCSCGRWTRSVVITVFSPAGRGIGARWHGCTFVDVF